MRVLVTGAAGFIGNHVVHELEKTGFEVVSHDLKKGTKDREITVGNLLDLESLTNIVKNVEAICHIGAIGDVYLALSNPPLAAQANVVGTANVMEAALQAGKIKVIYASTWEVYGKPQYQPIDENHPCNPDHPYNITKLAGERLALSYDHLKGVPVIGLRLGTTYGIGMRESAVMPAFIIKALKREDIQIHGDGAQFRQFTQVYDIAQAFKLALKSSIHGEVLNIVDEKQISIKALANIICNHFNSIPKTLPIRTGDVPSARVSSKKAYDLLNWKPTISFENGISELIDYYITAYKDH